MGGSILVLSGPSGCGKSSLLNEILKDSDDIYFSISTTTREKRDGEIDGLNYHYISKEQFQKDIDDGMFLEWARVHGNLYGTSLKPVEDALRSNKLVIFDIDVQGHDIVKERYSSIITSLFVTTPNRDILRDRLIKRATDSEDVIDVRIENAQIEMQKLSEYDYLLVNDDFSTALDKFRAILKVAKMKPSSSDIEHFRDNW